MILNRTAIFMTMIGAFACVDAATLRAQSGSPTDAAPADPATHALHAQQAQAATTAVQNSNASLVQQLAEMRARITQLETTLAQTAPTTSRQAMASLPSSTAHAMPASAGIPAQTSMSPLGAAPMQTAAQGRQPAATGGMSMMDMMSEMMSGMSGGNSGSMSGMPNGGGMSGMGQMNGMPGGKMGQMMGMGMTRMGAMPQSGMQVSALPGFPGATHIYHVGATGFFLDHAEHITLTMDQQVKLNTLKESALLEQSTLERKIEQAEQDLWILTGSDAPDATKVEAKAREVEQLRTDQRIAFIRAVGRAATILMDDQRKQLTGLMPPMPAPQSAMPQAANGSMAGMSDM